MNPQYRLQIDICLVRPVAEKSVWLRLVRYVPFVPQSGMVLRLTSTDEEETLDIEIPDTVHYDMSAGLFVADVLDEQLVTEYSETGTCRETALVESYAAFDFQRLAFPVGQTVKITAEAIEARVQEFSNGK